MKREPFTHHLTLGKIAMMYGCQRKTFKKMIAPLISGPLPYLADGRTRRISPGDQRLIAEFLGNSDYHTSIPRITMKMISVEFGWSVSKLRKEIKPVQEILANAGYRPRKALKPIHIRIIIEHLGAPKDDKNIKFLQV